MEIPTFLLILACVIGIIYTTQIIKLKQDINFLKDELRALRLQINTAQREMTAEMFCVWIKPRTLQIEDLLNQLQDKCS